MSKCGLKIRRAELADIPAMRDMQARSFFTLGAPYYPNEILEAFQSRVSTMDEAVVVEGHFFVTVNVVGTVVGTAAWSGQLPGYDAIGGAAAASEADGMATIRSVFVDPQWARCGIGTALMHHVEADALEHGIRLLKLKATLSGVDFYLACGYRAGPAGSIALGDGISFAYVPMQKVIGSASRRCGDTSLLLSDTSLEEVS